MRYLNLQVVLGIFSAVLSAPLYLLHFFIFQDAHHIFIYLLGNLAFAPIEVLLVTLIIHRLLTEREKRTMLKKLNMVIGAFFSEVGSALLEKLSDFDPDVERVRKDLVTVENWSGKEFITLRRQLRNYEYIIDIHKGDLEDLPNFLKAKRDFLLRMLENPSLLEHETCTNLLWAVFHLAEELDFRQDVTQLPDTYYAHLADDTKRAYTLLISDWLDYIRHLMDEYPYLFSLAIRMNPFDQNASPIIK